MKGLSLLSSTDMRNSKVAGFGLILSLLLVGAGCFQKPAPAPAPAPEPQAEEPGTSAGMRIAGNAIIISEQKPSSELTVTLFANDKPAFLVVREGEAAASAKLGTSALLQAGENTEFRIALSRPSKDGESLYVAGYADDGDGVFDSGDAPLLDGLGNALYGIVTISVNASEGPSPAAL